MSTSATFLGPVSELPAEGADLERGSMSEIDFCAAMFSDSAIGFEVNRDGATVISNPHEFQLFQRFEINDATEDEPMLNWTDDAFEIQLQGLFRDRAAFSTLSDASEPEDFVRRFLEVLASSLDDPTVGHEGPKVPLIRWQPGEDGNSARVQLLGLLLADEDQFEKYCSKENRDFGLIFEDAEVEAHGVRETLTVLALLGITLGSATKAEAGLFENIKKKREAKMQEQMESQMIRETTAPIQQQRSGWRDAHNDAYFNQALLAKKDGERKIIVDISRQRAFLLVDNQIAIDTAVSTARSDKYTPRGEFKITERVRTGKTSTIYGCEMPYWQRLNDSAVGLHIGDLPGYPASAGCIRLPYSVAPVLFENTASGVSVEIVDTWDMQELQQQSVHGEGILVAQVVQQDSNS